LLSERFPQTKSTLRIPVGRGSYVLFSATFRNPGYSPGFFFFDYRFSPLFAICLHCFFFYKPALKSLRLTVFRVLGGVRIFIVFPNHFPCSCKHCVLPNAIFDFEPCLKSFAFASYYLARSDTAPVPFLCSPILILFHQIYWPSPKGKLSRLLFPIHPPFFLSELVLEKHVPVYDSFFLLSPPGRGWKCANGTVGFYLARVKNTPASFSLLIVAAFFSWTL